MDADGWDTASNPRAMIRAVGDRVSNRKWRLFLAAAVRDARRFHLVPAVDTACSLAERFADKLVDRSAIELARAQLHAGWSESELPGLLSIDSRLAPLAVSACVHLDRLDGDPARRVGWLRELVGNPFRWVRWENDWLTRTVHAIATPAYAEGLFDTLPVLADALEDAGCDAADLLAHLRSPGPHTRGCWGLDVVLGKV